MFGSAQLSFVEQFNNAFGGDNVASTGGSYYRAVMLKNESVKTISSLKLWVDPFTDYVIPTGALPSSGTGTITGATGAFCGWAFSGWARIETAGGSLREIVYYRSRTDTVLTVTTSGRAAFGTTAAAGSTTDHVFSVPGVAIGYELASPMVGGSIQTISDDQTPPVAVSLSTSITASGGLAIGTIQPNEQVGIWISREIASSATAIASILNSIRVSFVWDSVTYSETLAGLYRIHDVSLDRYELFVGVDAEPDLTAAADEIFTTLPHTASYSFVGPHTYRVVTQRRNRYNLISDQKNSTLIVVEADDTGSVEPPTAPEIISFAPDSSGAFILQVAYWYLADSDDVRGDKYAVYLRTDGTDPDVTIDTPVLLTVPLIDGSGYRSYTTAVYTIPTTAKVIVRTKRSSYSTFSVATDVYTAVSTAGTFGAAAVGGFWRSVAEQSD
jgi:hypothetical protein